VTLASARALIVGAGGLGCPAGLVLARAGVGTIAFADDDRVEISNLHRQILHRTADAGRNKAESACDALKRIAAAVETIPITKRIDSDNVIDIVDDFDVVLDGSDNFATKFLINDACVLAKIPFVHAGAIKWGGQWLAVAVAAPCYRCLFEEMPPPQAGQSCREAGIVGPVAGVVGARQAEAALRLIGNGIGNGNAPEDGWGSEVCRAGDPCARRAMIDSEIVLYDGLAGTFRSVRFRKNPHCRACNGAISSIVPTSYEVAAC
jgi:molybdopterin-synthase adenylyltransferase